MLSSMHAHPVCIQAQCATYAAQPPCETAKQDRKRSKEARAVAVQAQCQSLTGGITSGSSQFRVQCFRNTKWPSTIKCPAAAAASLPASAAASPPP
eukprot:7375864-Prymnesium_polylepis.1